MMKHLVLFLLALQFCALALGTSSPLSCGVVSWNLAEKIPTDGEGAFIKALKDDDIVVLGSQECETVKFRRHEGHKSRAWHTMQRKALGKKYKNIASHSLGGIKLDVYVKSDLRKEVSVVKVMDVPCGIGNVIGNKGGICAVLKVRGSYLAVINSHFAAHQNKVKERNQDYERIVTTINTRLREEVEGMNGRALKKRRAHRKQQQQQKSDQDQDEDQDEDVEYQQQQQSRHVAQQPPIDPRVAARFDDRFDDADAAVDAAFNELFDAVIFLGDFNYRLNVPRLEIELARLESEQQSGGGSGGLSTHPGGEMEAIFEYDQLHNERSSGKIFAFYREELVTFLPTYKYDKNSDQYDSSQKWRSPAWTDRILFHSEGHAKEGILSLKNSHSHHDNNGDGTRDSQGPAVAAAAGLTSLLSSAYESVDTRTSDHRPVVSRFMLHPPAA